MTGNKKSIVQPLINHYFGGSHPVPPTATDIECDALGHIKKHERVFSRCDILYMIVFCVLATKQ